MLFVSLALIFGFTFLWRLLYPWVANNALFKERVLIVGTGDLARQIYKEMGEHGLDAYEIVGFLDENGKRIGEKSDPMIIGDFRQISSICRTCQIDRVVVALDERRGSLPLDQLLQCRLMGIHVDDGISFRENLLGKLSVNTFTRARLFFQTVSGGSRSTRGSRGELIFLPPCSGFLFSCPCA